MRFGKYIAFVFAGVQPNLACRNKSFIFYYYGKMEICEMIWMILWGEWFMKY